MSYFLRLLFLVPLGYVLAVLAAALTIVVGWHGRGDVSFLDDFVATGYVMSVAVLVTVRVSVFALVPFVIVIVLAEMFRWRSLILYLVVGGGLGLLIHTLHGMPWEGPNDQVLLPAAGFVGGFVYWLVAGRRAGIEPEPPSPASEPGTGGRR